MLCCAKDKKLERCNKKVLELTKYCKGHQYMKDYTDKMLNELKICSRCKYCHYSESNKTCDRCLSNKKEKENEEKQKKILCIIKDCKFEKISDNKYCDNHQYMIDYTDEMLNNLKKCSGCKRLHFLENMKTCDDCRNRSSKTKIIKNDVIEKSESSESNDNNNVNTKILCIYDNCKNKKSDENEFCKKHQRQKFLQDVIQIGKKACADNKRGCHVQLDINYKYSKCEKCLEKDREKYNDKKNSISEEVIDGHKICSACFKNYPEDHYIGNRNNITKTCKKCREDNKKQDLKRNKEHVNEIARANSKKPERIEVKKEWIEQNPEKSALYWIKSRGKKILCDYEKYLKDNSEYAKKWREENPEKVLENNEKRKNNINYSYKNYKRCANDKNLLFEFTLEEFKELTTKNCYYCGELQEKGFNGIDRKNCDDNYIKECCVSCCSTCNYMKGSLDDIVFLKRIEHILTYQGYINGELYPELFGNHLKVRYNEYKKRAEDILMKEFNLTSIEFLKIIGNNCYICGKEPNNEHLNGIDRVDNDKGYTLDNVSPCCGECNFMKKNYDLEEFFEKMKKIYNNKLSDIENDDNIIDIGNKNNNIIEYSHVNRKSKDVKKEEGILRKQFKKDIIIEQYTNEDNIKERINGIVENRKNKN